MRNTTHRSLMLIMDSVTDHALTSEGPGNQPGGIARQALSTEQSKKGPGRPGGIIGSVILICE